MPKYLKEILAEHNAPMDMEFVNRSELLKKEKRGGGTYECYEYNFLVDGNLHQEKIFPTSHPRGADKILAQAQKGDICRAQLNAKGFVDWSILPRGEAVLQVPHPPVTKAIQMERQVVKEDRKTLAHDWKLGIAGLLQAHLISGKEVGEARRLAIEDARWVREVSEMLAADAAYKLPNNP